MNAAATLPDARMQTPVDWSPRARSVWGKTEPDGDGWLPLVRHLTDASAVAGELWDHWLPAGVRRVISADLPRGEDDGRRFLTWVAGLHDIGKATPGFAVKVARSPRHSYLLGAMADHGLVCPPSSPGLPPHCHVGQFVLAQALMERYSANKRAAYALTAPIGMHHGTPPGDRELGSYEGHRWVGRHVEAWRAVQAELVDGITELTGAIDRLPEWLAHPPKAQALVLLTAAVVVADWLSSDVSRFPYDDYRPLQERLDDAGLADALRGPWRLPPAVADAESLLQDRFPHVAHHGIHPIQREVRDVAACLSEPALLVIEAPMGSGKTEAALMAAEEMARTSGAGGVFVALPTMATSDAMVPRVLAWAEHLGGATGPTMHLAHGKARLNEDYHVLVRRSQVEGVNDAEHDPESAEAVVTSWLQGRRKGVLANLVVGTIDQVLFGALKTRHLALRHLALAGKVVIIDEVHAADTYMRRYLARVLEWLGSYGTPVILLSATLPPAHLEELTAAYARGRGVRAPRLREHAAYPRITVQTADVTQTHVPWVGRTTEVRVHPVTNDLDDLVRRVRADVEAGGCVVVIRNTVGYAQQTYAALREALGTERVSLVHSRFAARDRASKERALLGLLGPPGPRTTRPAGYVVVGTQVLEQSLDIDADVMETDHAPIDLLLQRMGRLHRHHRGEGERERPAGLREPVLRVIGAPTVDDAPVLDAGSAAIYGERGLLTSGMVLAPHLAGEPVRLPGDIAPLVEQAYAADAPSPPAWAAEWEKAFDDDDERTRTSVGRAKPYRLGEPWRAGDLVGWLDGRDGGSGQAGSSEDSLGGRAQVRDTEDLVEVLLVWRDGDGVVRVLPGDGPDAGAALEVGAQGAPSSRRALSVLGCSVRLPRQVAGGWRLDSVIRELEEAGEQFAGWQSSPWLQGQLVLCLDDGLRAVVGGWRVRYDVEMGLLIEEKESRNG